jgi:hypothetical protein
MLNLSFLFFCFFIIYGGGENLPLFFDEKFAINYNRGHRDTMSLCTIPRKECVLLKTDGLYAVANILEFQANIITSAEPHQVRRTTLEKVKLYQSYFRGRGNMLAISFEKASLLSAMSLKEEISLSKTHGIDKSGNFINIDENNGNEYISVTGFDLGSN